MLFWMRLCSKHCARPRNWRPCRHACATLSRTRSTDQSKKAPSCSPTKSADQPTADLPTYPQQICSSAHRHSAQIDWLQRYFSLNTVYFVKGKIIILHFLLGTCTFEVIFSEFSPVAILYLVLDDNCYVYVYQFQYFLSCDKIFSTCFLVHSNSTLYNHVNLMNAITLMNMLLRNCSCLNFVIWQKYCKEFYLINPVKIFM